MPDTLVRLDVPVTLLLTCVTPCFTVQASDRRLTLLNGKIHEEQANKATIWSYFGSFAFTGLAMSSTSEPTDEMVMRVLGGRYASADEAMRNLADEATRTIGKVRIPGLSQNAQLVARRTSLVGCGFMGLHDPASVGRSPVPDNLHPFITVISNAQTLAKGWRGQALPKFGFYGAFLPEDQMFLLHDAGQPVPPQLRKECVRLITSCLRRGVHAEAVARVLARTIREVSRGNRAVGPNVTCTFVHRDQVKPTSMITLSSGPMPIVEDAMTELSYFRRMQTSHPPRFIYSPGEPTALVHYGPNYAGPDMQIKGMLAGPSNLVATPSPTPATPRSGPGGGALAPTVCR